MIARIGRLALTAIVLSAVGAGAVIVLFNLASGGSEPSGPANRWPPAPPGSAALPWRARPPADEYRVAPLRDNADPDRSAGGLSREALVVVLALSLILAIAIGAIAAVALASGSSPI